MNWQEVPEFSYPTLTDQQIVDLAGAVARLGCARTGLPRGGFMRVMAAVACSVLFDDKAPELTTHMIDIFAEMVLLETHEPSIPSLADVLATAEKAEKAKKPKKRKAER